MLFKPVTRAAPSFVFHCSATLLSRGSSGLGADNNAWILNKTTRICNAGDHLSYQIKTNQIRRRRNNHKNNHKIRPLRYRDKFFLIDQYLDDKFLLRNELSEVPLDNQRLEITLNESFLLFTPWRRVWERKKNEKVEPS